MVALSLDAARNAAIIVVVVFVATAIASAWLMKSIAQKVALVVVLGLLALLVRTQRAGLDKCANDVKDARAAGRRTGTTCSFLGQDITITSSS